VNYVLYQWYMHYVFPSLCALGGLMFLCYVFAMQLASGLERPRSSLCAYP
jgi:hypothetical protein